MSALITKPGFYPELTPAQYFGEPCPVPALTNSGVQMLAPIGAAPAKFAHQHPMLNPDSESSKSTSAQYLGSVTHRLALGKGADYLVSPFDEFRSKEAKEWKADVEARGVIPIKPEAFKVAEAVATVLRERIDEACQGEPYETEVVIAWQEEVEGFPVWCRAMVDVWCPSLLLAIDAKTTADASDEFIQRRLVDGYAIQDAWYRRGLGKLTGQAGRVRFGFLFVENEAPFLHRHVVATEAYRFGGSAWCNRALSVFADCMKVGEWPGYSDFTASPPPWWVGRIDAISIMEAIDG